jgi:hypothetical protein
MLLLPQDSWNLIFSAQDSVNCQEAGGGGTSALERQVHRVAQHSLPEFLCQSLGLCLTAGS